MAALFVAVVGIGPVAGGDFNFIFSFGMITKLFYESIKQLKRGPIEAVVTAFFQGDQNWRFILLRGTFRR